MRSGHGRRNFARGEPEQRAFARPTVLSGSKLHVELQHLFRLVLRVGDHSCMCGSAMMVWQ